MKRYSPILFIWLMCLVGMSIITTATYCNGDFYESIAWLTGLVFLVNLIVYHLYATKDENKKDSQILDE